MDSLDINIFGSVSAFHGVFHVYGMFHGKKQKERSYC